MWLTTCWFYRFWETHLKHRWCMCHFFPLFWILFELKIDASHQNVLLISVLEMTAFYHFLNHNLFVLFYTFFSFGETLIVGYRIKCQLLVVKYCDWLPQKSWHYCSWQRVQPFLKFSQPASPSYRIFDYITFNNKKWLQKKV